MRNRTLGFILTVGGTALATVLIVSPGLSWPWTGVAAFMVGLGYILVTQE